MSGHLVSLSFPGGEAEVLESQAIRSILQAIIVDCFHALRKLLFISKNTFTFISKNTKFR
jgi:hypothetical protein